MEKNTAHLLQEIQKAFYNPDFGQENWEVLRKKVDTALATSQPESPAPLSAEEMVDKVREILDDELDVTTDNWGHYVGTKGKDEAASRIAALLSQRQPVAPEREEERMSAASQWFDGLSDGKRQHYIDTFPRLTVRGLYEQVMSETSPSAENKGASGSADGLSKKGGEG